MTKRVICGAVFAMVMCVVVAHAAQAVDIFAAGPTDAEEQITGIVERVFDMLLKYFGLFLDEIARFIKEIIPFFGE